MPMWREEELTLLRIVPDVDAGLFFIAENSGDAAGTMKFQLDDSIIWPDAHQGEAAYIHRLAVRRRYAGTGLSSALLHWAVERTQAFGRPYLRLDCHPARPRLRAIYEHFGFRYHSEWQVGSYHFARYEFGVTKPVT